MGLPWKVYMNARQKNKFLLKEFVRFLKKRKAYTDFLINVNTSNAALFRRNGMDAVNFIAYAISHRPMDIINDAFEWCQTTQSHSYWSNMDDDWCDKVDEIMDKINKF